MKHDNSDCLIDREECMSELEKNEGSDTNVGSIEEDIKFTKEMIKEYKTFGDLHNPDYEDTDRIYKAIENILAERKQDKARIKELEEEIVNKENKIWQLKETIQDLENECISLHELIDEEM